MKEPMMCKDLKLVFWKVLEGTSDRQEFETNVRINRWKEAMTGKELRLLERPLTGLENLGVEETF